jgi:hypothetical protein
MNIAPTPEYQRAFKHVTGLDCTPHNVITTIRNDYALFMRVREVHADIVMLASQRRLVNGLTQRLTKHKPNIKKEETER